MLNEEVDQLAAIPHLDHFDHFVRDHRTQRHERKHKKEYLMMTNTQKHLLFILFSTHVCVCMCLEYFRIIRPYLSRDWCSMESPRKTLVVVYHPIFGGDTWTCSHHPVQGGENNLKVGLHLMLTDWCWQIDCRLLLINYVWSQSSWDIRQPILEEVANISKKDKYVGPLLNIDIYMGPGGQRFFFSAANLPFFSGSNHQMFQILVDPTVPMWIQ